MTYNELNELEFEELETIFKLFACTTRLKILTHLTQGECIASDFIEISNLSSPAVSHQLKSLKAHRIIKSRKSGKNIFYSLNDHHILAIVTKAIEHIKGEHCNV